MRFGARFILKPTFRRVVKILNRTFLGYGHFTFWNPPQRSISDFKHTLRGDFRLRKIKNMKYNSSASGKLWNEYAFFDLITETSSALTPLTDKIWMIYDQKDWCLYSQRSAILFTLNRMFWWHLLNCWMLGCYYHEMCEMCCHFDASHLWEVWIDLYEQILKVQSTSSAPMAEYEL